MQWKEFWDKPSSTFANRTHALAHYSTLARSLLNETGLKLNCTILDYGCGDALAAPMLADGGFKVFLYDQSLSYMILARSNSTHDNRLHVIDCQEFSSYAEYFDAIVLCSVIQYLDAVELNHLVSTLKGMLSEKGKLYLVDVPSPCPVWKDAVEMAKNSLIHGYFFAFLRLLVRRAIGSYGSKFGSLGISRYRESDIFDVASEADLDCVVNDRNFTLNQLRSTYILSRR